MYGLTALAATLFCSLALAADHVPVTIENLDQSFDVNCGSTTVAGKDIYNAVAWGMSLNDNDETFTGTGEDGAQYPSYYGNSEKFKWVSPECDDTTPNARQHMPVIKGGFFGEDGKNDQGVYRAVYWYNFDEDAEGHGKSWYCGTIYHAGSDNSFAGCDVVKA